MSPVALKFADGTVFFVGVVLTPAASWVLVRRTRGAVGAAASAAVFTGALLAVLSATPVEEWQCGLWLALGAAVLIAARLPRQCTRRVSVAFAACLTLMSLVLLSGEWPFRRSPVMSVSAETTVFVLGDSLSAGIEAGERTWPAVLAELTGLRVVNLARPGARLGGGLVQAQHVRGEGGLVMLELGGNDLLGGGASDEFRRSLDRLLFRLTKDGARTVAMFELPLPPFANEFGAAQRDMADSHGVVLIPKRILAGVLSLEGGTVDGIHLSPQGHAALGRAVAELIEVR